MGLVRVKDVDRVLAVGIGLEYQIHYHGQESSPPKSGK